MSKFVLFTTGGGSADPLNWSNDEAALYSISEFKGMKPASSRTIDLFFDTAHGKEVVTLGVKNMTQVQVMKSITTALATDQPVVTVADVDNAIYCNPNIQTVSIASQENFIQTLTNNSRTKINIPRSNYSSCIVANIDGSANVVLTLELYDGTTYTKLISASIPAFVVLKLEQDEISFDNATYDLYATSGDSDGQITFTFSL